MRYLTRISLANTKIEKETEKAYVFSTGRYGRLRSGMAALPKSICMDVIVDRSPTMSRIYNVTAMVPNWWLEKLKEEDDYLYGFINILDDDMVTLCLECCKGEVVRSTGGTSVSPDCFVCPECFAFGPDTQKITREEFNLL